MEQQEPAKLTPDEIKLLVESGDITPQNLQTAGLTPAEKREAMKLLVSGLDRKDAPMMPPGVTQGLVKVGKGLKKGYDTARASGRTFFSKGAPKNVEKLGKEAFDDVGRAGNPDRFNPTGRTAEAQAASRGTNVTKTSPLNAIKSDDYAEIRKILFGGLNSAKDKYLPLGKGPLQKTDIMQMGQNIKEISKAGASGVVRRRKP